MKKLLIVGLESTENKELYIAKELLLQKLGFDVTLLLNSAIETLSQEFRRQLIAIKIISFDFNSNVQRLEKLITTSDVIVLNASNTLINFKGILNKTKARIYADMSSSDANFQTFAKIAHILFLDIENHQIEYDLIESKIIRQKVNTVYFYNKTGSVEMLNGSSQEQYISIYKKLENKDLIEPLKKAFFTGLLFSIERSNMTDNFMRYGAITVDLYIKYRENILNGISDEGLFLMYREQYL